MEVTLLDPRRRRRKDPGRIQRNKAGLVAEKSAKDNFTIRELWHPSNRLWFIVGPAMFIFQDTTGSSVLAVFAPQYFKLLVARAIVICF